MLILLNTDSLAKIKSSFISMFVGFPTVDKSGKSVFGAVSSADIVPKL